MRRSGHFIRSFGKWAARLGLLLAGVEVGAGVAEGSFRGDLSDSADDRGLSLHASCGPDHRLVEVDCDDGSAVTTMAARLDDVGEAPSHGTDIHRHGAQTGTRLGLMVLLHSEERSRRMKGA